MSTPAEEAGDVVARVAGRTITRAEISCGPAATAETDVERGEARCAEIEQQRFATLARNALLSAAAVRLGVDVGEDEIASRLQSLRMTEAIFVEQSRSMKVVPEAALKVLRGGDPGEIYENDALLRERVTRDQFARLVEAFGSPAAVEELIRSADPERLRGKVLDDLRMHVTAEKIAARLTRDSIEASAFWNQLIEETGTVVLDSRYRLPNWAAVRS